MDPIAIGFHCFLDLANMLLHGEWPYRRIIADLSRLGGIKNPLLSLSADAKDIPLGPAGVQTVSSMCFLFISGVLVVIFNAVALPTRFELTWISGRMDCNPLR